MKFRSFRLSDFAQHQDVTLEFADGAPSLIIGPNESGKSNLLTALIGTLFGLTPAEANAYIPWAGAPAMCASLDFEANDERIMLVRHFLEERVEVVRDSGTIYSGRGRTFGRGIAEDERYRELLAGWLGFNEMEIFRDLVFVEQDQLSDRSLGKQAPEIKRLITGSREASYESAAADLTAALDRLKKLPRKKNDREIELLEQTQAKLIERVRAAEESEAAVVDLRDSELETSARLAEIQTQRTSLADLLQAHGRLVALRSEFTGQTEAFARAERDWQDACSSAQRHSELSAEIDRLRVPGSPDLDSLRRLHFELDDAADTVRSLQMRVDALDSRRQPSAKKSSPPSHTRAGRAGPVFVVAAVITLLSLLFAFTVDPRALIGLLLALILTITVLLLPKQTTTSERSPSDVDQQLANQERTRLQGELARAEQRLARLSSQRHTWLSTAGEPDLTSLLARLEQLQKTTIKLENTPVVGDGEISHLLAERQNCLAMMALSRERIEQLEADRPELLELTPDAVTQHRQTIADLDARAHELDQVLRTNEIQRGVLSQTTVDDAAALQVALREIEAELERKQQLAAALELAIETLRDCVRDFQENALDPVADDAGRLLARMTGGRHQRVRLDQETMEPTVRGSSQNDAAVAVLSRGTRDQLYLAIRLALVDTLAGGISLPLIFDDPCVHFDAERLAATSRLLADIARERQVIILTKDTVYTNWFRPALELHVPTLVIPNGVSS